MIVGQIGAGRTAEELLADYPYLEREDILEALRYAAWRAQEREIELPLADEATRRHESFPGLGDFSVGSGF
ncbi:MAG: DUF433 domain-containing protein [Rhodoplanes sp.]